MQLIRRILVLVMLVSSALVTLPTAASAAEPTWAITARGNGHGLGMSQWGASGMANAGRGYQEIFTTYYQNTTIADNYYAPPYRSGQPYMNVSITNATRSSWNVSTSEGKLVAQGIGKFDPGSYKITFGTWTDGTTNVVTFEKAGTAEITYVVPSGGLSLYEDWYPGSTVGAVGLAESSGSQGWSNVAYEGALVFTGAGTSYTVKNRVLMESYLNGVVPREMPASWNPEALKAQALAARSYALNLGFTNPITDLESKLVACTESFQVYNGYGRLISGKLVRHDGDITYAANITAAVAGTAGQVGVSGGKVIAAYFSSSAGGYTESSENVWLNPLPYIKGIKEPYPNFPSDHIETKTFTGSQIVAAIRKQTAWVSQVPADAILTGFRISKTGASPRPTEFTINTANYGTKTLTGNTAISNFCRSNGLGFKSTYIEIVPVEVAPSGKISRIWGASQCDTSVEASKRAFPAAGSAPTVIVAAGPIDALTASGLAGVLNGGGGAPILITWPDALADSVRNEIVRLGASKVYVVGGTVAVRPGVESALKAIPSVTSGVERLAGNSLYDTAYVLNTKMKEIGGDTVAKRAIILNGAGAIDAVGAAGFSFASHLPIVPVESAAIPASSQSTLRELGVTQSLIVGGQVAVSPAVVTKLGDLGAAPNRIAAGVSAYGTSAILANYLVDWEGFTYSSLYVSSGQSLVDGLAAGPLAGKNRNPLILTPRTSSDASTNDIVYGHRDAIASLYILGGTAAVTSEAEKQIDANFLK